MIEITRQTRAGATKKGGKVAEIAKFMRGNDPADWGGCPKCHRNDGFLYGDDGRENWFICKRHKVKWLIGTGRFSSCEYMSDRALRLHELQLSSYQQVKGWWPPREPSEDDDWVPPG
jgi:hypothetical protein